MARLNKSHCIKYAQSQSNYQTETAERLQWGIAVQTVSLFNIPFTQPSKHRANVEQMYSKNVC